MLAIGVNGYGTIGKRVADAVAAQPDMRVSGVAKRRPDASAVAAIERGYPMFVPPGVSGERFVSAGLPEPAPLDSLIERSDIIVDATPGGVGETYLPTYQSLGTPAILQGKESDDLVDTSFCAQANFDAAIGAETARVVSCNSTGLARTLTVLDDTQPIDRVHATLIRRGADPAQSERGPLNDIVPDPISIPSHHAVDVETVMAGLDITTTAVKVPATLMHVHAIHVRFDRAVSLRRLRRALRTARRIQLIPGTHALDGVAALAEHARDRGRPRADIWEICVWEDSLAADGRDLYFFQAIHQESNVVPENIDAVRALAGTCTASESMRRTDDAMGIGDWQTPRGKRATPTQDD